MLPVPYFSSIYFTGDMNHVDHNEARNNDS